MIYLIIFFYFFLIFYFSIFFGIFFGAKKTYFIIFLIYNWGNIVKIRFMFIFLNKLIILLIFLIK